MMGRRREINLQLLQIVDMALVLLAFALAYVLRLHVVPQLKEDLPVIPEARQFTWVLSICIPLVPLFLEKYGFYTKVLKFDLNLCLRAIFRTFFAVTLSLGLCVIFFKWQVPSRTVVLFGSVILVILLLLRKYIVMRLARKQVERGERRGKRVIVAGAESDIEEYVSNLDDEDLVDFQVVDRVNFENNDSQEVLQKKLHETSASRVIFLTNHLDFGKVQQAISMCELEGVEAWLPVNFLKTQIARPTFESIGGSLVLVFRSAPEWSWQRLAKSVIDRLSALILIILSSPLWLIVAIGIKWSSKGSIFFKQNRSGLHGHPFEMYKFRTMSMDAEERKKELAEKNEMDGPVFKVKNDPRVFRFGQFLRKCSIDELPQLLNVLKGEMSLVGPRPLPTYEIERITEWTQRRRLSVKPGITCLWQVRGRNKITSFEEWVDLDLEYIDSWSFWLDLKILLKTIPVVLFGGGAS